jgi:hypothetical protein
MTFNCSKTLSALLSITVCTLSALPSCAALPDTETHNLVTARYHLLLQPGGRGNCSYYANPETLRVNGSERFLSVLHTGSPMDGTVCNGIFEFKVLSVRCDANEVSYSDRIASPANWIENWHSNPNVASRVCAMTP